MAFASVPSADPALPSAVDDIIRRLQSAMDILQHAPAPMEAAAKEEPAGRQLSAFRPVADQFGFINKVSTDIRKLSITLQAS